MSSIKSDSNDRKFPELAEISFDNYFRWLSVILTLYHSRCQHISPHGLIDLVIDDTAFAALPGHDASTARPNRDFPAAPADTASAAVVALYNRKCSNLSDVFSHRSELKIFLLLKIGTINETTVSHATNGTMYVTELTIIQAMTSKYGQLSTATLRIWKTELQKPIGDSESIEQLLCTHKRLHNNFAGVKQIKSEADKIEAAEAALVSRTAAGLAISKYKMDNPDAAKQTFADFAAFLVLHEPNMPVTASAMNYAAHASTTDFEARVQAAVDARLAAMGFAAGVQAPSATASAKIKSTPRTHLYCYCHGYQFSHVGAVCKKIAADTRRYSKAKVNATDHLVVLDGNSFRS
jgi:hypothetical protein